MSLGTRTTRFFAPLAALAAMLLVAGALFGTTAEADPGSAVGSLQAELALYNSGPEGGETILDLSTTNFNMLLDSDWTAFMQLRCDAFVSIAAELSPVGGVATEVADALADVGANLCVAMGAFDVAEITRTRALIEDTVTGLMADLVAAVPPTAPSAPSTGNAGLAADRAVSSPWAAFGLGLLALAVVSGARFATRRT